MQDASKAFWSIPYVSVAFFSKFKTEFYSIFTSCDNQALVGGIPIAAVAVHEIIKIDQSSHKMYSNNILNFQESTTILNAGTKKSGNLLKAPRIYNNSVKCKYRY